MFKLKPLKPVVLAIGLKLFYSLKTIARGTFKRIYALKGIAVGNFRTPRVLGSTALVLFLITPVASAFISIAQPAVANATTSSTLNFQARLETASGAIAPDGNYNVEFKLYNALTSSGSSQGSCTGDAACLWTETRTGANQVRVANGYLTVNLGSVTAFGSINWDQQLYLTMRIGGTGAPSWDTEMSPRITLTAVPYAFQANSATQLQATVATNTGILTFDSAMTGGNQTFVLPDQGATGTFHVLTQEKANAGYIQLQSGTPGTAQTGNFNIGSGTGILGTLQSATGASGTLLTVQAGAATTSGNNGGNLLLQGGAGSGAGTTGSVIVKANTHDTTSAFQVQNAGGANLFTVDTTNTAVVLGNDGTPSAITVRGGAATASNTQGSNITFDASNGTGDAGSGDIIFRTAAAAANPITLDATSSNAASAASLTWAHVTGVHSNEILIVGVGTDGAANNVTAITYNGVALTKINSQTCPAGNSCDEELWYLVSPATGSHNVVVSLSGSQEVFGGAATYYNVNTTTPFGTSAVASGTSRPSSINVTTNNSQLVVDGIMDWSNGGLGNPSAGQTKLWEPNLFGLNSGGSSKPAGASSTNMGWAIAGGTSWADVAVPINPVANTTADTLIDRLHIAASGNIGISNANPQYALDVTGTGNFTTSVLAPILDTATAVALNIGNTTATSINLGNTTNNILTTINGTVLVKPTATHDSTTAFQVQRAGGSGIFTVDTLNTAIVLGNDVTPSALNVRGGAATGSNVAGSNITFSASNGTGTGGSGDFIFKTAASTGTVTLDATSKSNNGGSTSSLTWSHTVASQSNRILIVGLVTTGSVTWTGVTWNGTALTHLGSTLTCPTVDFAAGCHVDVWYLLAPAAGTFNIVATSSVAANSSGGAVSYYNVDQTTPFGTVATATGSTTGLQSVSDSVTSTSTNQVVLGVLGANNTSTNGNGTQLWNDAFVDTSIGSSKPGTGGSVSVTYNVNSGDWGIIGVPINAAANSAADTLQDRFHITAAGNVGINTASPQYTLDVAGTGNFTTAVQTPLVQSATATNLTVAAGSSMIVSTNGVTRATFDTANNLYLGNGVTAAAPNNFVIQGTGSTTTAVAGGSLALQGGNATVGNANGGNLTLSGGTGIGTGVNGIVLISTPTFQTAASQSCGVNCTITQANVDGNGAVIVNATATGLTVTLPNPTITTAGKIMYVTAANASNDFTLSASSGAVTVTLHQNTTATMIWNGSAWTAAGASNATTLQATYNNGTNPSSVPEIKLDSTHGTIDIQDADTTINADLLDIRGSNASTLGTVLFGVSSAGRVTVQNVSDPTSAFRILDASGNYAFNSNPSAGYTSDNNTRPIGNGIQNPSFESGGNITGGEEGWIGSSQASIVNSSANAHTGNYELQITPNGLTQNVYNGGYYNVEPGDVIYLEAWVKNSAGANGSGSPVGVLIEGYDKAKALVGSASNGNTLPGTSYVLRSATYTVPSGVQYVRVAATVPAAATAGTFYFDDFYMHSSQRAAAVFQNSADSTAAFLIQSAGAAQTLFSADTTDNLLKVGDSSGTDTNTTIFVLDSASSNITTLTRNGVSLNGGLFYNSTTNSIEAVIGGAVADVCTTAVTCTGYSASASSSVQLQSGTPGTQQTGNFNISGTGILSQLQTQDLASGNTSNLVVRTGNATSGNSGNLTLDTGTASGTAGSITIGHTGVTTTMPGTLIIQGSSTLSLGTASSATGSIKLYTSAGANTVTIQAAGANPTASWNLTLPQNPGNSGDCLKDSTGTGTLAFSNCTAGATTTLQDTYNNSSSPATITLADGKDIKIVAQDTTTDPSIVFNLQCVTSCGTTGGRFAVQNGGTDVLVVKPNSGGIVLGAYTQIGSATTDATQVNLQLDSYNGATDSGTCSTTTNQGALYYNTTMGSIRGCVNGSWSDISNPDTLGLLTFGIIPSSGSTPYDLPGLVTTAVSGPCKVSWASNTTVTIQSCIAYSGGRRVNINAVASISVNGGATTPSVTLTTTNIWTHLCLDGNGNLMLTAPAASPTANLTSIYPSSTFNIAKPQLCFADIKGSATTGGQIAEIYDTRTFTSTIKEAVNMSTAAELGMLADSSAAGLVPSASCSSGTCSGKLYGIVIASDGSTSTGTPNAIVATVGSAWVKMTAGNAGEFVHAGPTSGYGVTVASVPNNAFYYSAGNARTAFTSTCTSASTCTGSVYVNMLVR